MRNYIKNNWKMFVATTAMLIGSVIIVGTNELLAHRLPEASELTMVACHMQDCEAYAYTGAAIEPEIKRVIFRNVENQTIVKEADEITVLSYSNHTDIGTADMEVSLKGYQGTIILEDAFSIKPGQVKNLSVKKATQKSIDLTWDEVIGADGYVVFRSTDLGKTFEEMQVLIDETKREYSDKKLKFNKTYLYKVCAFMTDGAQMIYGNNSGLVSQITPLAPPKLTDVKDQAYNTLTVVWEKVDGAAGYRVYRSMSEKGEYECIGTIDSGKTISYQDKTCECGITYYYYIEAEQRSGTISSFGEKSNVMSGFTTPNKVSLKGKSSKDDTKVTLSWNRSKAAQGYEIYRSTESSSDYKLVKKIEQADVLTWTDTGLDKKTSYYYRIRPYCEVNKKTMKGKYSYYQREIIIETDYSAIVSEGLSGVTQFSSSPYVPGGTTPKGWDCSGFTQWVMKQYYGVSIPKAASAQGSGGKKISVTDRASWQPGDILCYTYGSGSSTVRHVGLYLGNGQMMHALGTKHGTLIQSVDYYERWDPKTRLYSVKRYH